MKKLFFTVSFLLGIQFLNAQNTAGLQNDLKGIVASGGNVTNTTLSTFNSGEVKGNRYLYNDWTHGTVTADDNVTYSSNYTFNFDKINQDVYAKYSGQANISVLLDKTKIKYFTIGPYKFINSILVDGKNSNSFYEVLNEDSNNVSLYKHTTTKFVKADPTDMVAVKNGDFSSKYVDDTKYYVLVGKELKKINFSENHIKKALKIKSDKVDAYFKMNPNADIDENFLINLITYINK